MTERDVIAIIKSVGKPYTYVEKVSQSNFSQILIKYEYGLLKPKTIENFFEKFGFIKSDNGYIQKFDFKEIKKKSNGSKRQNKD